MLASSDRLPLPEYHVTVIAEDEVVGNPRRDAAMVTISFNASPVAAGGQTNTVIVIILGVLAGCLLLIIVVLSIYIYRKYVLEYAKYDVFFCLTNHRLCKNFINLSQRYEYPLNLLASMYAFRTFSS